MRKPTFEHRHYVKLASIIAALPEDIRNRVAEEFTRELRGTNERYSATRFFAAAMGAPSTGRDKAR